jgi:hypothetical protein
MGIQDATSLKELLQGMTPAPLSMIIGKFISYSPLKVEIVNDEKLVLNDNTIINSRLYRNGTIGSADRFAWILVFGGNKNYYILDTYTEE